MNAARLTVSIPSCWPPCAFLLTGWPPACVSAATRCSSLETACLLAVCSMRRAMGQGRRWPSEGGRTVASAIDGDVLAVHVASSVGHQEAHHVGHVLRCAHPTVGKPGGQIVELARARFLYQAPAHV